MTKATRYAVPAGGTICLRGQLTDEGTECQAFRDDAGDLYTLVGDLGRFATGDPVVVCGTIADVSFCNQGTTLAVTSIGHPHGHRDLALRTCTVEARVTRSSADNSPLFRLEGRTLDLAADGRSWKGTYPEVAIEGPLQIVFHSEGWPNQVFDLEIVVKHPSQPAKDQKAAFRRVTSKGEVFFSEEMPLS
jgi:hypothetical protein